jgi:acetoin utilization protein AcuB
MERELLIPQAMGHVPLTVADFMSRVPHTIGAAQPLAAADRLMREHDLRHLPVLEVGRLVGILSQRELDLLFTAPEIDGDKTPVSRAMMRDVLVVSPHDLVSQVAAKMAERRVGSAVVATGGHVVGVFTTVDALRALTVTA